MIDLIRPGWARVVEWDGPSVVLRDGSANVRQGEMGHLLARGAVGMLTGPRAEELGPVGPVLAAPPS